MNISKKNYHDRLVEIISEDKENLETILDFQIRSIIINMYCNNGRDNNCEIDLFIKGVNDETVIIEVKPHSGLTGKFSKQLPKFRELFPDAKVYLAFSRNSLSENIEDITFKYYEDLRGPIQYY